MVLNIVVRRKVVVGRAFEKVCFCFCQIDSNKIGVHVVPSKSLRMHASLLSLSLCARARILYRKPAKSCVQVVGHR